MRTLNLAGIGVLEATFMTLPLTVGPITHELLWTPAQQQLFSDNPCSQAQQA